MAVNIQQAVKVLLQKQAATHYVEAKFNLKPCLPGDLLEAFKSRI